MAANPASPKNLSTKRQIDEVVATLEWNDRRAVQIEMSYSSELERLDSMFQHFERGTNEWYLVRSMISGVRAQMNARVSSEMRPVAKLKVKPTVSPPSSQALFQAGQALSPHVSHSTSHDDWFVFR